MVVHGISRVVTNVRIELCTPSCWKNCWVGTQLNKEMSEEHELFRATKVSTGAEKRIEKNLLWRTNRRSKGAEGKGARARERWKLKKRTQTKKWKGGLPLFRFECFAPWWTTLLLQQHRQRNCNYDFNEISLRTSKPPPPLLCILILKQLMEMTGQLRGCLLFWEKIQRVKGTLLWMVD